MRQRDRHCQVDGEHVCDCKCYGPIEEFESCGTRQCPEWSEWSSWSSCSKTCGEGEEGECQPGEAEERRGCKDRTCPEWSMWGDWSACSATCGQGSRDRVRSCGPGARYLDSCPGESLQLEPCSGDVCKGWGEWTEWSTCSVSCGEGSRRRRRECGALGRESGGCEGEDSQEDLCPSPGWDSSPRSAPGPARPARSAVSSPAPPPPPPSHLPLVSSCLIVVLDQDEAADTEVLNRGRQTGFRRTDPASPPTQSVSAVQAQQNCNLCNFK